MDERVTRPSFDLEQYRLPTTQPKTISEFYGPELKAAGQMAKEFAAEDAVVGSAVLGSAGAGERVLNHLVRGAISKLPSLATAGKMIVKGSLGPLGVLTSLLEDTGNIPNDAEELYPLMTKEMDSYRDKLLNYEAQNNNGEPFEAEGRYADETDIENRALEQIEIKFGPFPRDRSQYTPEQEQVVFQLKQYFNKK
mgnify:CR=1 FL=1